MKKRIFIFKNDEIGDFCLWIPFVRKLRGLYPEHEIIIGVKKELKHFAKNFDCFDRVTTVRFKYGVFGLFYCIFANLHLFFRKYDMVIGAVPGLMFSNILIPAFFMLAKQKYIFYRQEVLKGCPHNFSLRTRLMGECIISISGCSIFDFNKAILKRITGKDFSDIMLKEDFSNIPPRGTGKFAVMAIGSSAAYKNWPAGNFRFIAQKIIEKYPNMKILLAGNHGEYELAETIAETDRQHILNLCGKTSLEEIIGYQKNAAFSLCNDTGLAHISALMGKRTFIIGGCGHFGVFIPWQKKYRHVTTFFSNCENRGCNWVCSFSEQKDEAYPCVKAVSPKPVWTAIEQFSEQELSK